MFGNARVSPTQFTQQVKIVVPYIPGGATDTAGRVVAEKMGSLLGQQVIVENRGGGNTIIGMELVAKSKPDGHTLLLGTTTLATNAALGLKLPESFLLRASEVIE